MFITGWIFQTAYAGMYYRLLLWLSARGGCPKRFTNNDDDRR